MDIMNLNAQAEKYKEEMLRLYGKSTSAAVVGTVNASTFDVPADTRSDEAAEAPEETVPQAAEEQSEKQISEDIRGMQPDNQSKPQTEPQQEAESTIEERFPEPNLSELPGNMPPASENIPETTENPGDFFGNGVGYILVNVRTGDDSLPLENASVKVTGIHSGKRFVIASALTDSSGRTPKFEIPAPVMTSLERPDSENRAYSLYDISVTANGFFNARSVDVPVFDDITSVQNFSMIPLPLYMRPDSETVITYNSSLRI